jgi:flagellin-like protein
MEIKQLFTDDSAVSPVIGVILMVAITVILAAVIGSFVLNLGGSLQQTAPQASFGFDYDDNGSAGFVVVTHESGDTIDADRLTVVSSVTLNETVNAPTWSDSVGAGDQNNVTKTGGVWAGETIRVIWTSQTGEASATLSQSTAPS